MFEDCNCRSRQPRQGEQDPDCPAHGDQPRGTAAHDERLVPVQLWWSRAHGDCYECGLPAAYRLITAPALVHGEAALR